MTHPHSERWSDYLDGELSAAESRDLEAHLETCSLCASLVGDLRRVVARAGALEDRPPRTDLWPEVSAKIGLERRRFAFTIPQLLAASFALVLLSGGGVALLLRGERAREVVATRSVPAPPTVISPVAETEGYSVAIGRLQRELARRRGALDTTTVRIIEAKLALIDQAILDAERAVMADPNSAYLQAHLTRARLTKLDLLRRATELTRTVS